MLTTEQKNVFSKNDIICLSTASKLGIPRSILVAANFIENDKSVLKIQGEATYQTSGEYFDKIESLKSNEDYAKKAAIVIKINSVEEVS